MKVDPVQGQLAVTAYREGLVWLELCLHTSRTHQIRAHCAALRRPVLGNPVHDSVEREPLHLHARAEAPPLSILMNDHHPYLSASTPTTYRYIAISRIASTKDQ